MRNCYLKWTHPSFSEWPGHSTKWIWFTSAEYISIKMRQMRAKIDFSSPLSINHYAERVKIQPVWGGFFPRCIPRDKKKRFSICWVRKRLQWLHIRALSENNKCCSRHDSAQITFIWCAQSGKPTSWVWAWKFGVATGGKRMAFARSDAVFLLTLALHQRDENRCRNEKNVDSRWVKWKGAHCRDTPRLLTPKTRVLSHVVYLFERGSIGYSRAIKRDSTISCLT